MMAKVNRLFSLSMFLPLLCPITALADCTARFDPPPQVTLPLYNPFSSLGLHFHSSLQVQNISSETCALRMAFLRNSVPGRLGQDVSYSIIHSDGTDLIYADGGLMTSGQSLPVYSAGSGAATQLEFFVDVSRGQMSSPGYYLDTVTAVLLDEDGRELDRQAVRVALPVASISELSLAGGGVFTAINFDVLEAGKTRSAILETRSNQPYALEIASEYGGSLRLSPAVPGHEWTIPYRMQVDGADVDLREKAVLTSNFQTPSESRHRLDFTIEETDQKRAGLYKDRITTEIVPAY